jgi:hypothetical protein
MHQLEMPATPAKTPMIRLKDVFALPGTPVILTWSIRSTWFPEIELYGDILSGDPAFEIEAEGRMRALCIFEHNFDGERFADMHTISFDGKPVMVVRDGGRGGRDTNDRFIVDENAYLSLCQYIRQKMGTEVAADDLTSPDKLFYPEELFNFYGSTDFASELGYPVEPSTKGFQVFADVTRIIQGADPSHVLVEALTDMAMPLYLRRQGFVMERVRALTDEELGRNPRVMTVSLESGYTQHWWYVECERPADAVVVKI